MGYQNNCPACGDTFPRSRPGVMMRGQRLFCSATCAGEGAKKPSAVDPLRRRARSILQEKEIAAQMGARRVVGSGAFAGKPGDNVDPATLIATGYLVEAKFTDAAQFQLKADVVRKALREALEVRRRMVMQVRVDGLTVAVVEWEHFLELICGSSGKG